MQDRMHSAPTARGGARIVVGSLLMIAACLGIVFWAWQGSVLGVLLSAMLPGAGAIWILAQPWNGGASGRDRP